MVMKGTINQILTDLINRTGPIFSYTATTRNETGGNRTSDNSKLANIVGSKAT